MYEVTLRRRETVAEGTLAFYFDKPAGFSHDAGQNVMLSLIEPPPPPPVEKLTAHLRAARSARSGPAARP